MSTAKGICFLPLTRTTPAKEASDVPALVDGSMPQSLMRRAELHRGGVAISVRCEKTLRKDGEDG